MVNATFRNRRRYGFEMVDVKFARFETPSFINRIFTPNRFAVLFLRIFLEL